MCSNILQMFLAENPNQEKRTICFSRTGGINNFCPSIVYYIHIYL